MNLSTYLMWGVFMVMTFYYFFGTLFYKDADGVRKGMAIFVLLWGGFFFGIMGLGMYQEPSVNDTERAAIILILLVSFFASIIFGKKYPIEKV